MYKLKDYDGEPVRCVFYEAELQKVKLGRDKSYQVEEILDKFVIRGDQTIQQFGQSQLSERCIKIASDLGILSMLFLPLKYHGTNLK